MSTICEKRSSYAVNTLFTGSLIQDLWEFICEQEEVYTTVTHHKVLGAEYLNFRSDDGATALRFAIFKERELLVRYALLRNTRQGTLTHCVEMIRDALEGTPVTRLKVESVLTEEMLAWCEKQRLSIDLAGDIPSEQELGHNYAGPLFR